MACPRHRQALRDGGRDLSGLPRPRLAHDDQDLRPKSRPPRGAGNPRIITLGA